MSIGERTRRSRAPTQEPARLARGADHASMQSHSLAVKRDYWGVHVLVSQNGDGGLTLGDTHEYGATHDPFQREALDRLVLAYLDEFACIPERSIAEHWTGCYPKLAGKSELVLAPMPGVTLVNALGGAGMTMSFGLAEEIAAIGVPLN
jgi:D-hydroxyproline dehydrogenase subunit beta